MDSIFNLSIYITTTILLLLSLIKSKRKTFLALKKSLKMLMSIMPQFIAILLLMSILLSIFDSQTIKSIIGAESGALGILISSVLGSIILVPALIAFPIANELLENGAGVIQITTFIGTLTTVGLITLPIEFKYLGKKVSYLRNGLFFVISIAIALIMGVLL